MITVAGTIYSITIVALTLASVQFAPRVLGSFMRDRTNQLVLGFFVATFTYCLLVLRSVGGGGDAAFVPGTAVAAGVLLALISLGMLIYFIDHIFHSIQASSLIATVAAQTLEQINAIYPDPWREGLAPAGVADLPGAEWTPVPAARSGYLQYVDTDLLLKVTTRADVVVREERAVGAFVIAHAPLASISPASKLTSELKAQVNEAFMLGTNPTMQQDIAYGIRQIVDIAIKAISPAVNDPTTALNCIDHIGVILTTLATRLMPDLDRSDANGNLRIIIRERTFHDLARLAFDQIRHFGASDPVIVIRMLDTITQVAHVTRCPEYRDALCEQVEHIAHAAEQKLSDDYELKVVRARVVTAKHALHMDEAQSTSDKQQTAMVGG